MKLSRKNFPDALLGLAAAVANNSAMRDGSRWRMKMIALENNGDVTMAKGMKMSNSAIAIKDERTMVLDETMKAECEASFRATFYPDSHGNRSSHFPEAGRRARVHCGVAANP